MKRSILLGCLMILLISCKDGTNTNEALANKTTANGESFKRVFSDGDYNFQLEYNNRLDTSYFDVLYQGKKVSREGYRGRVGSEFLADINRDEKNEVYFVAEHGDSLRLIGFLMDEGKSTPIAKKGVRKLAKRKASSYSVQRNQLIEKYEVLSEKGERIVHESRYNLVKNGEAYELLPQGWQPFELSHMTGQYVSRDDAKAGYYKVMVLGQRDGGKWKVDIKVKRNGDKKILCSFNGVGEFIDRDLYVPLDQANPDLKGSLQIRFLNLMAAVYTENKSDYKEMISFCPSKGSIAGNFKKTEI